MGARIVAIDCDRATLSFIADLLNDEGYEVYCFLGHQINAGEIQAIQPDLVLLEFDHQNSDATFMLLNQLRTFPATRTTPIMVSSTDSRLLEVFAALLRPLGCTTVVKPFDLDQLLIGIAQAILHNDCANLYDTARQLMGSNDFIMH